jgi:hypothetical protein
VRALGLVLALTLGCQRTEAWPTPPISEGARSQLLVSLGPAGSGPDEGPTVDGQPVVGVQVIDPTTGRWQSVRYEEAPELRVYDWSCEPGALGLPIGELTLVGEPPDQAPIGLPPPIIDHLLEDGTQWVVGPRTRLDGLARFLPFNVATVCAARGAIFALEPPLDLALAEEEFPAFAFTLGNGQVVIGTNDGQLFGVRDDGVPELLTILTTSIAAAAPKGADELWLLARDGTLAFGRPSGPWQTVSATIGLGGAVYSVMSSAGPDEEEELFLVSSRRKFARYDGQRWTILSQGKAREWPLGERISLDETIPNLLRLGPGHVLTYGVTDSDRVVVEWRDGELIEHSVGTPPRVITGVATSPVLGWVALAGEELYFHGETAWAGPFDWDLQGTFSVAAVGSGLLASGLGRRFAISFNSYHPSSGTCRIEGPRSVQVALLPLGEDRWLSLGLTLNSELQPVGANVQVLRRTRDFIRCSGDLGS